MKQYLDILQKIFDEGVEVTDRTGVGTKSVFGMQARYDLREGFPLVTTKKTFLRGIVVELIWLIRWDTNIKYLVDRKVGIWNEWPFQNYLKLNNLEEKFPSYSDEWMEEKKAFIEKIRELPADDDFVVKYGDLGPVYGKQWRDFNGEWVDQIQNLVERIKSNPECRRLIVSAWNPAQIQSMLLPPCHSFFQFNVDTTNNVLNLQLYQRSADTFLGVPFNIASYSTLLMLIAKITGYTPGTFVHTLWDAHIYQNHYDQVHLQLSRDPLPLPELKLLKDVKTIEDIEKLEWEDFELLWYESHERIVAPVAV